MGCKMRTIIQMGSNETSGTLFFFLIFAKKNMKQRGFGSLAIHPAAASRKAGSPHTEAIYPTSTYQYDDAEELMAVFRKEKEGFIYSRWSNPGFEQAEATLAAMECWNLQNAAGEPLQAKAQLFSSGMAAISSLLLACLRPGDKLLTQHNLYGGSTELMNTLLKDRLITCLMVDLKDLDRVEHLLQSDPAIRMLYLESPTNPTMEVYDLEQLSALARKYGKKTAVDNTFCTPYLQQPFQYGIDAIVHSTTKYLHGHGWAIGGALVSTDLEFMSKDLFSMVKLLGGNSNAFDAWLLTQGLKTLELRMDRHCSNALQISRWLEQHPAISKVHYAGLPSHPDHALAQRQMRQFGGMLSFELKGGLAAGIDLMNRVAFCTLAVSLGTVDTIIQHPASMSHVCVPRADRERAGIGDGLIRFSAGIENVDDILNDLEQALA